MSNGELFGRWNPSQYSTDEPSAIIAALPRGINSKVLVVGPADSDFSHSYGIPVNFTSIGAAMAVIPLVDPDYPTEQRTILVTPGTTLK